MLLHSNLCETDYFPVIRAYFQIKNQTIMLHMEELSQTMLKSTFESFFFFNSIPFFLLLFTWKGFWMRRILFQPVLNITLK